MKYLFPLLAFILAACSTPALETIQPERTAVAAFVKALPEVTPGSYKPVGWGNPIPFLRRDSARCDVNRIAREVGPRRIRDPEIMKILDRDMAITDLTPVGTWISHDYWARNKDGVLYCISNQVFAVYRNGEVEMLFSGREVVPEQ
jgi:hypothetical protein